MTASLYQSGSFDSVEAGGIDGDVLDSGGVAWS